MKRRLRLLLAIAATGGLAAGAWAADMVEPTAAQKARCDQAVGETAKRNCLSGYSVRGLRFPAAPLEGAPNQGVPSMALYKPPGPGPFPALVLLHTCGAFAGNDQLLGWARTALAKGYVVFALDSFTQRGVTGDRGCSNPGFSAMAVRARDAFEALAYLAQFPFVDKARIAAMGFSQGARVSYLLANDGVAHMFSSGGRFAAIVAVYGQCFSHTSKVEYVRSGMTTPVLALLGGKDKDGDPAECLPRLEKAKAEGAPVEWHVFDWVGHVWDQPSRTPGRYAPFNEPPYQVWFQYDEAATQQSHAMAFAFLGREMH